MKVHYPFHPLRQQSLEVLAWPRQANLSVTVRHPDGSTLKIPLWMLDPAAARIDLHDQVELSLPAWLALAALLGAHSVALATVPEPRHADANAQADQPRSRRRGATAGGDPTRMQASPDRPDGAGHKPPCGAAHRRWIMKSADSASKITARHLARKAVVYLRQSSIAQVRHNVESQRLQYALKDTAKAYGFAQVEVIDVDLGMSASSGARVREGFKQLLASVALGEVGIVLSREPSRLSRTDKDWCHLMELCRVLDTLIGDADSIYDLNRLDDQLLLGIKGTLSVMELKHTEAAHAARPRGQGQMWRNSVVNLGAPWRQATSWTPTNASSKIRTCACSKPWRWCSAGSRYWAASARRTAGSTKSASSCR